MSGDDSVWLPFWALISFEALLLTAYIIDGAPAVAAIVEGMVAMMKAFGQLLKDSAHLQNARRDVPAHEEKKELLTTEEKKAAEPADVDSKSNDST